MSVDDEGESGVSFQSLSVATEKKESNLITILIDMDGRDCGSLSQSFTTERSVPLRRIFLDFCHNHGFRYSSVGFWFSGRWMSDEDRYTAEFYGMVDADVINGMQRQGGPMQFPLFVRGRTR